MGKNVRRKRNGTKRQLITAVVIILAAAVGIKLSVFLYDRLLDRTSFGSDNTGKPTASELTASELTAYELAAIRDAAAVKALGELTVPDYVNIDYIAPSRARTEEKLTGIHNIVIHYTGNPGTTAKQNRHYFGLSETTVCSHFLVGLDGEIIQCIPLCEQSAASNFRNVDTISIEVCHPGESGKFTDDSYRSAVKLAAWLCKSTGLTSDDLIRHHDITGKECPKYFVDNVDSWEQFKSDVQKAIAASQ